MAARTSSRVTVDAGTSWVAASAALGVETSTKTPFAAAVPETSAPAKAREISWGPVRHYLRRLMPACRRSLTINGFIAMSAESID